VSGSQVYRLQSILNAAARLVFTARRFDHVTPYLRELHWLKITERIQFRLCVLVFRCLYGTAPAYFADSLHLAADNDGHRRLRSAKALRLLVPATRRSTLSDHAFPVAAATAWNTTVVSQTFTVDHCLLQSTQNYSVFTFTSTGVMFNLRLLCVFLPCLKKKFSIACSILEQL
jgi:hypothetical protein